MLIPCQKTPNLQLPTVNADGFDLAAAKPQVATLLVFYRGLQCPACVKQLTAFEEHYDAFAERGIELIAISGDGKERAQGMVEKAGLQKLPIGYGLPLAAARQWGLFISASRGVSSLGIEEPALYSEPGLFLIKPDSTLYFSSVQSMPGARPRVEDLLAVIDYTIKGGRPARGEYDGPV